MQVVVATDDARIADVCKAAGAEVVMTSETCPNGEQPRAQLELLCRCSH